MPKWPSVFFLPELKLISVLLITPSMRLTNLLPLVSRDVIFWRLPNTYEATVSLLLLKHYSLGPSVHVFSLYIILPGSSHPFLMVYMLISKSVDLSPVFQTYIKSLTGQPPTGIPTQDS